MRKRSEDMKKRSKDMRRRSESKDMRKRSLKKDGDMKMSYEGERMIVEDMKS